MKITTDSGTNVYLSAEQCRELGIEIVPLSVTLDGHTYREGLDVSSDDFYSMLDASENMPTTSQLLHSSAMSAQIRGDPSPSFSVASLNSGAPFSA